VPLAGAGLAVVGLVLALVASRREKTLVGASAVAPAAS
jgi:hypothetical protein